MKGHLLLRRNVKRLRGGLEFKARRLVFHSTLGPRVIKMNKTAESRDQRANDREPRGNGDVDGEVSPRILRGEGVESIFRV